MFFFAGLAAAQDGPELPLHQPVGDFFRENSRQFAANRRFQFFLPFDPILW
jgi:hypothetical protein